MAEDAWRPVPLGVDPADVVRQDVKAVLLSLEHLHVKRGAAPEHPPTYADAQIVDAVFANATRPELSRLSYKARFCDGAAWCDVRHEAPTVDEQIRLQDAQARRRLVAAIADATNPAVIAALTEALKEA